MQYPRLIAVATALAGLAACGGGDASPDAGATPTGPVSVDPDAPPAERLSAYNLFTWDPARGFALNDRVIPYDVNSPLFSDYALKHRAIYLPPGATATYDADRVFDLPVGSVVIKNFYFPADLRAPDAARKLIETRLMVRRSDGWRPQPYIWDDAQRDAVYAPAGEVRAISFIDATGAPQVANYLIPQRNDCQGCHADQAGPSAPIDLVLIGLKARHLNRSYDYGGSVGSVNQLDRLAALGMLTGAPTSAAAPRAFDFRVVESGGVAAIPQGSLDAAARSYLDINCAHCHNPRGVQGMTSQLFLDAANSDDFHLGICKRPGSAGPGNGGLVFDIVPGQPDSSILYFRTQTSKVGAMMPLLGRSLTHARGAELLRAWITAMPPIACSTP